jgi:hypothetical protein
VPQTVVPTTREGVWPERAETVDAPETLTVIGVDRGDDDLSAALRDAVPAEADALCLDRPASSPSIARRARCYVYNPALVGHSLSTALIALRDLAVYGTYERHYDRVAVEDVAGTRGLPVVEVGGHPVVTAPKRSLPWRLGGWIVALAVLLAVATVLSLSRVGGGIFLLVALSVLAAYLLAYAGATMDDDVDALFGRVAAAVESDRYRHPVVIVRSSRRRGVADRAKSARIRTRVRQLSPAGDDD